MLLFVNRFPGFRLATLRHATAFSALAVALFGLILPTTAAAQPSRVFDDLSMQSDILDMERKYAVYLPSGYEMSERSYPVLYLLHGRGDDQTGWVQFGEVQHYADEAISSGEATPMIIVMPDANTGRRGYYNDIEGKWRYEDFFFDELMPHVESVYRIKAEKRYRAVAGLSMGGGGSFVYAMHRPDLFSSAAPLSAVAGPLTVENMRTYVERDGLEADPDEETLQAYFERYSPAHMAGTLPEEGLRSVRWFIDCGDDDFLFEGNALVHVAFRKRGIRHEYRVRDGAHNWTYWRESLPEVLHFVSQAFHQY